MKRFYIIQNIPSPYRVTMFEEMYRQLKDAGFDFHVFLMSKGHKERPKSWLNPKMTFPYSYWLDCGFGCHHFNPGIIFKLLFKRPDVLFVGSPYDTFTGILVAIFLRARVKCTWVEGQTKTPGKMGGFIGAFKRFVLSRFEYVAVPGSDAAKYIEMHQKRTWLKMPKPIFLPNLIDESRFKPREEWPKEEIAKCRAMFGAKDDEKVCLIPARLDLVKGLVPFMEAVNAELVRHGWRIVIMGQGPCKEEICKVAEKKGIRDHLTILDYVPYDQMPVAYAAADLFLLPSIHDPNPLSVPEALHSGLPIALSDRCGNVEEGVDEGVNGWKLPVLDDSGFHGVLNDVFSSEIWRLKALGTCSKINNAEFWNTVTTVNKFLNRLLQLD